MFSDFARSAKPTYFKAPFFEDMFNHVENPTDNKQLFLLPPGHGATEFAVALVSYCISEGLSTMFYAPHANLVPVAERTAADYLGYKPRFSYPGTTPATNQAVLVLDPGTALDQQPGKDWFNRLLQANPEAKVFMFNFMGSFSSLTNMLARKHEWITHHYPAISTTGEPLWPEKFSKQDLWKKQLQLGSRLFSTMYLQQDPISIIDEDYSL